MRGENAFPIPHELFNAEVNGVVASAEQIKDYNFNKSQEQLNTELQNRINAVEDENASLSRVTERHTAGLNSVEEAVAGNTHDIGELGGTVGNLSETVGNLSEQSTQHGTDIGNLQSSVSEHSTALENLGRIVRPEFDEFPINGSHKLIDSDAVYNAIHSAKINTIEIHFLDGLIRETPCTVETPTVYTVITRFDNSNYKLGNLFLFSDDVGHKLIQVFMTSLAYNDEDGSLDITDFDNEVSIIYRTHDYDNSITNKSGAQWSRWHYINNVLIEKFNQDISKFIRFDEGHFVGWRNVAYALENIGLKVLDEINADNLVNPETPIEPNNPQGPTSISAWPQRIPTAAAVYNLLGTKALRRVNLDDIGTINGEEELSGDISNIYTVFEKDTYNREYSTGLLIVTSDISSKHLIQVLIGPYKIKGTGIKALQIVKTTDNSINILFRDRPYTTPPGNVLVGFGRWHKYGEEYDDKISEIRERIARSEGSTRNYVDGLNQERVVREHEIYDLLSAKIADIYINNGIRVFDGFVTVRPISSRPFIDETTVAPVTPTGEVLWYSTGRCFLYRDNYGKMTKFYKNWSEYNLYQDENGVPLDTCIYVKDGSNYRYDSVEGTLKLIEDSTSITIRLNQIESLVSELQLSLSNAINDIEDIDYSIKDVTYNELYELIELSQLIPGLKYRIIDYCSWFSPNKVMCGHNYDIIVEAITPDELSPFATADFAKYSGDDYFIINNTNIREWKLKYNPMVKAADKEKYSSWLYRDQNDYNPEERIVIIKSTGEVFYCNSFADNKLHYQGTSLESLPREEFQTDSYAGIYAEFISNPNAIDPRRTDNAFIVYRGTNGLDSTEFEDTAYHHNEIIVLKPSGCVYNLIDEDGNDVCFDFKNLKNKVYGYNSGQIIHISKSDNQITVEPQPIQPPADRYDTFMSNAVGFDEQRVFISEDDREIIVKRYPINTSDYIYAFTFNSFGNYNATIDTTVVHSGPTRPVNNKIYSKNVLIQTLPSGRHVLCDNEIYDDYVTVVGSSVNNAVHKGHCIINCNEETRPENEVIFDIFGNSQNSIMIYSNKYHEHLELMDYINSLNNNSNS